MDFGTMLVIYGGLLAAWGLAVAESRGKFRFERKRGLFSLDDFN